MRVLITGGGGFVGSHLVDSQLAQGHRVRTLDLEAGRLSHLAGHPRLEAVIGDLRQRELVVALLAGVDVVYHLASAHLDTSLAAATYWAVNVEATQQLLEAARNAGVRRFVYCSTNGVVGSIAQPPADEGTPCWPDNIYGQTKLAAERASLAFHRETGLEVVVARPSWVYGPRCPRTARLLRQAGKGRFLIFGDGATLRHPVYVADCVRGLELCAESEVAPGQVYFIAGPEVVTIEALVRSAAAAQGREVRLVHLPVPLGLAATTAVQQGFAWLGRRPPLSRRSMDFFLKDNAYDIAKARRELGFAPQVDLRSGLAQTVRFTCAGGHIDDAVG